MPVLQVLNHTQLQRERFARTFEYAGPVRERRSFAFEMERTKKQINKLKKKNKKKEEEEEEEEKKEEARANAISKSLKMRF